MGPRAFGQPGGAGGDPGQYRVVAGQPAAAAALFSTQGYQETSMRQIAPRTRASASRSCGGSSAGRKSCSERMRGSTSPGPARYAAGLDVMVGAERHEVAACVAPAVQPCLTGRGPGHLSDSAGGSAS
ncbi:TetR family transcriptional regulator [Nonomuraea phyllanthi]|uniref:TetR family transcriptional regulator n=1 Tax=Nonomuraea phyllanthi TaxID=2219224 RepID=A0A5C4VIX7_9ACTN|nr:TetR family transcriptional regulator [Nonomuraea phyllanthi]